MNISTAKKLFIPLVLAAFLVVGLFGLFHFTMNMNAGGQMHGCPLMNVVTLCTMNPFTHIAVWQNMFIASFSKDIFSLFTLALLAILFSFTLRGWKRDNKTPSLSVHIWRPISQTLIIKNPLQEAFSNGILHPKIF